MASCADDSAAHKSWNVLRSSAARTFDFDAGLFPWSQGLSQAVLAAVDCIEATADIACGTAMTPVAKARRRLPGHLERQTLSLEPSIAG